MRVRFLRGFAIPVVLATVALYLSAFAQSNLSPVMRLVVDETQASRKLVVVHEEIQVGPGALALAYPKWIPGEHGPTGPIQQFAGLQIHRKTQPWHGHEIRKKSIRSTSIS